MTYVHDKNEPELNEEGDDAHHATISETFYKLFESYPNSKSFFTQFRFGENVS